MKPRSALQQLTLRLAWDFGWAVHTRRRRGGNDSDYREGYDQGALSVALRAVRFALRDRSRSERMEVGQEIRAAIASAGRHSS